MNSAIELAKKRQKARSSLGKYTLSVCLESMFPCPRLHLAFEIVGPAATVHILK